MDGYRHEIEFIEELKGSKNERCYRPRYDGRVVLAWCQWTMKGVSSTPGMPGASISYPIVMKVTAENGGDFGGIEILLDYQFLAFAIHENFYRGNGDTTGDREPRDSFPPDRELSAALRPDLGAIG
jgi:hypothetical protein